MEGQGYDANHGQGYDFDDRRPMLTHTDSQVGASDPYHDNPQPATNNAPIKRWKTVKQVLLYRGNLVLDCPIPPALLNKLPHGERDEFTHMRYTAATCDPGDFYDENFTLRQKLFSKPRHTELFIVVTMYNEDEVLFARTMIGVFKNIQFMCNRPESKTWGKDAWKKIVVCVVSDGRAKINPRTRALLAGMGVYQEGIAKQQVNNKDVTAHIYEYTTQVGMAIKDNVVQLIPKQQPVQMLFCLKEKNQKKINSHRWFFQAFGRVLDPNICILLDAGTKPGGRSCYDLWKAFDLEPMCAGACGEIKAMLGTCLDPDTMVRTTQGPKAIRDIAIGDQLFDHQDNPVQCLAAEAIQTSPNMKKVTYTEWNSLDKTSFTCTPDHIMTLLAHSVKPIVHTKGLGVMWWTHCDRTELKKEEQGLKWDALMHRLYTEVAEIRGRRPTDDEVRQYLRAITREPTVPDSEDEDEGLQSPGLVQLVADLKDMGVEDTDISAIRMLLEEQMNEYLEGMIPDFEEIPDDDNDIVIDLDACRKRKFGSVTLATSSRASDPTYRQTPEPALSSPLKGSQKAEPAPSSPLKESQGASESQASSYTSAVVEEDHMAKFEALRDQLSKRHGNSKCKNLNCKGVRQVSIKFKTKEQAKLAHELLSGDHYRVVDPCAVKDLELFTMTMEEYLATCTPLMPQKQRKLRLYRAPLRFEPYQGPEPSIPIDPYWLGFWLGDGTKKRTEITSADQEIKVYLLAYIDRLNANRPAGSAPVKLVEKLHHAVGSTGMIRGKMHTCQVDTYTFEINSVMGTPDKRWNPLRTGLRDLGLLGDKSSGIPDCYMNANEDTRLAVLAGLIESDGWLQDRMTMYGFSQTTYEHKKIVEDAHKLALSCGIHCSNITEVLEDGFKEPTWRFYMRKGAEKFQHHLLIPRKRMDLSSFIRYNRDVRTFDVEDAGQGEYRTIEVSGGLYQLADRTVVHNCGKNLLNPLVATQNFEYKMSNILDKPLESAFGFISVLPGAFSAYRYVALQNDKNGQGPLEKYFAGEKLHGGDAGIFTANMYLAEDRILCFELVTKRNCHWILQYVKSATGETDVPDTVTELILQRRRWLNGSFFAALYAIAHFHQFFRSDHSFFRKIMFFIEFVFQTVNMIFAWFAIGNFFLVFKILTTSLGQPDLLGEVGSILGVVFAWLYGASLITCFVLSMGNRPAGSGKFFMAMVIFWAIIFL